MIERGRGREREREAGKDGLDSRVESRSVERVGREPLDSTCLAPAMSNQLKHVKSLPKIPRSCMKHPSKGGWRRPRSSAWSPTCASSPRISPPLSRRLQKVFDPRVPFSGSSYIPLGFFFTFLYKIQEEINNYIRFEGEYRFSPETLSESAPAWMHHDYSLKQQHKQIIHIK